MKVFDTWCQDGSSFTDQGWHIPLRQSCPRNGNNYFGLNTKQQIFPANHSTAYRDWETGFPVTMFPSHEVFPSHDVSQSRYAGRRFYVNKKDIPCETSLLTENRVFSKNVLKLSFEQLSIFVNEVKYWDGTVNNKGDVVLDTTDKESRDMVATACSLIGIKSC